MLYILGNIPTSFQSMA